MGSCLYFVQVGVCKGKHNINLGYDPLEFPTAASKPRVLVSASLETS